MKRLIGITALLLAAGTAMSFTIHVPRQYSTIQAGINAANDGDTVLVADGTYTGEGNKNLDFGGRAIVVISEGGPENCIIDCELSGRGFYFHSGETSDAMVEGLTILNGRSAYGGGVHITDSSPIFKYCIIRDCDNDSYGGGVYVSNGDPSFINCTICRNEGRFGGAIYADSSNITINSCIIAWNSIC